MAIPPVISVSSGQTPAAIPPKISTVPPKIVQAQSPPVPRPRPQSAPPPIPRLATARPAVFRSALTARQKAQIATIACAFVALLVVAVIHANKTYWSPRHSIVALASAMQRRDRETVAEYVDAPTLAESIRSCVREAYRTKIAKESSNDFFDRLFNPLGEEIVGGLADVTFTPESVIRMMCGESPQEAMKHGVADYTDHTVDAFTKDGSPKTQIYGTIGKVMLRWGEGFVINEATADAKAEHREFKPDDFSVSAQYESASRYLITITPKDSGDFAVGCVFRRQGLGTWRFSEVRLLPQDKSQFVVAAAR